MSCRGEVPFASRSEIIARVARDLNGVLAAARATVADPDYWGEQWCEVYRGNPLLPAYVMVDLIGNVVHAQREATSFETEHFTVTYLPSWFYQVVSAGLPLAIRLDRDALEAISAEVSDRDRAVPLRIEVEVTTPLDTRLSVPGLTAELRLPQVTYDIEPSHGSLALLSGQDPAVVAQAETAQAVASVERVHWTAPSIRITAAPGVTVTPRPLFPVFDAEFDPWKLTGLSLDVDGLANTPMWGWFVMNAAQCAHDSRGSWRARVTSTQALDVQIERRQNAEALPRIGDPRRVAGSAEVDLLAGDGTGLLGLRFEEVTRPDGVELLFLTSTAAVALASARREPAAAMLLELLDPLSFVLTGGGLPPHSPLPVRIRVDPQSPQDRFAYSVTYLNAGTPVAAPWMVGREGPFFRLTVIRTDSVAVNADLLFTNQGAGVTLFTGLTESLAGIVEFRERVVPFDEVPTAILDSGDGIDPIDLRCRDLTNEEIADLIETGLGFLPFAPIQVMLDLKDYADILCYLTAGTNAFGEEMGRLEFAVTLAGVLLPEVLEKLLKQVPRLVTVGDAPAARIAGALDAVKPVDVVATIAPLLDEAP